MKEWSCFYFTSITYSHKISAKEIPYVFSEETLFIHTAEILLLTHVEFMFLLLLEFVLQTNHGD